MTRDLCSVCVAMLVVRRRIFIYVILTLYIDSTLIKCSLIKCYYKHRLQNTKNNGKSEIVVALIPKTNSSMSVHIINDNQLCVSGPD